LKIVKKVVITKVKSAVKSSPPRGLKGWSSASANKSEYIWFGFDGSPDF